MRPAHDSLDRERVTTILADAGAPVSVEGAGQQRGLNFSFVRTNADPERAQRELVLVVDVLAARPELVAAYEAATVRLKETGDETEFAEQQRLRAEIEEADRRLARLVLNDETI